MLNIYFAIAENVQEYTRKVFWGYIKFRVRFRMTADDRFNDMHAALN